MLLLTAAWVTYLVSHPPGLRSCIIAFLPLSLSSGVKELLAGRAEVTLKVKKVLVASVVSESLQPHGL